MKILVIINLCLTIYLFILLKKEQLRTKVVRAFIAGNVRNIATLIRLVEKQKDDSIGYSLVLREAVFNFLEGKELCDSNADKFIKKQRFLFGEEKRGFSGIYFDFIDRISEEYREERKYETRRSKEKD